MLGCPLTVYVLWFVAQVAKLSVYQKVTVLVGGKWTL